MAKAIRVVSSIYSSSGETYAGFPTETKTTIFRVRNRLSFKIVAL